MTIPTQPAGRAGSTTTRHVRARHRRVGRASSRRRARALDVRRHLPGGDASPRHSSRVARERRTGLERCARNRALRRQIDDELSAGARRYSDSRRPGRSKSHAAAQAIVRRESAQGPLVLKPLFGSQGRGLKLIRTADELPPPDAVGGRLLPAALRRHRGRRRLSRFPPARLARPRHRRHDAARCRLDHERQARRTAASHRSRQGDEGNLPLAPLKRWGQSLPGSTSFTARMGAPPCSRSTACRPGRACRRSRAPASRGCSRAILSPRSRRGRSAGRRRDRACGKSCRRLQCGLS